MVAPLPTVCVDNFLSCPELQFPSCKMDMTVVRIQGYCILSQVLVSSQYMLVESIQTFPVSMQSILIPSSTALLKQAQVKEAGI